MSTATIDLTKVLAKYDLLVGGYGPTVESTPLTDGEKKLLDKFFENKISMVDKRSPVIADLIREHKDLVVTMAEIFKAKTKKTFGGELPGPSNFGIRMLLPLDLAYDKTTYPTAYDGHTWKISLTAGTTSYLLGDATTYYRASSTTNNRAIFVIFKNGIIEVGTSPKIDQIKVDTEKAVYPPFGVEPLADITVEKEKRIYIVETPFAIPVWYDFGLKMAVMPQSSGTSDLRLIGVVLYEYGYHSSLTYIS